MKTTDLAFKDGGAVGSSGAGRARLAVRIDTPLVKASSRGSILKALKAGSVERRAETLEKLRRDEVAASGQVPRAAGGWW